MKITNREYLTGESIAQYTFKTFYLCTIFINVRESISTFPKNHIRQEYESDYKRIQDHLHPLFPKLSTALSEGIKKIPESVKCELFSIVSELLGVQVRSTPNALNIDNLTNNQTLGRKNPHKLKTIAEILPTIEMIPDLLRPTVYSETRSLYSWKMQLDSCIENEYYEYLLARALKKSTNQKRILKSIILNIANFENEILGKKGTRFTHMEMSKIGKAVEKAPEYRNYSAFKSSMAKIFKIMRECKTFEMPDNKTIFSRSIHFVYEESVGKYAIIQENIESDVLSYLCEHNYRHLSKVFEEIANPTTHKYDMAVPIIVNIGDITDNETRCAGFVFRKPGVKGMPKHSALNNNWIAYFKKYDASDTQTAIANARESLKGYFSAIAYYGKYTIEYTLAPDTYIRLSGRKEWHCDLKRKTKPFMSRHGGKLKQFVKLGYLNLLKDQRPLCRRIIKAYKYWELAGGTSDLELVYAHLFQIIELLSTEYNKCMKDVPVYVCFMSGDIEQQYKNKDDQKKYILKRYNSLKKNIGRLYGMRSDGIIHRDKTVELSNEVLEKSVEMMRDILIRAIECLRIFAVDKKQKPNDIKDVITIINELFDKKYGFTFF